MKEDGVGQYSTASSSGQDLMNGGYEQRDPGLLPGLPNDLALQCLVRVPRRCHSTLAMVCKQWKELILSREYYFQRKEMSLTEGWIYALSRDSSEVLHWHAMDPMERKWRKLPPMPGDWTKHYGMTSAVLNRNLFVLGGGKKYQDPISEVIKYDPITNTWMEAPDMKTARCYFICAAFDGRLYAIGGMGLTTGVLTSWEVYDEATECWSFFEDPNIVADLGESLVVDKRLYIRHVCASNFPPSYAAMFNSAQNSWVPVHDEMTREWCGPTAIAGNDVYMLDQTFGLKLVALDKETLTWKSVGRLAPVSIQPPCRIAVVGRNLYVLGKGLRTTLLNLDSAGKIGGLLVTSSFKRPNNSGNLTVSCHVLEM